MTGTLLLLALVFPAPARGACPEFDGPRLQGTVASKRVREASGLVASRSQPGVLWVHNDSGDVARLYAVGADGSDLGAFLLHGASNVDWEDLAIGPGPEPGRDYLYAGDIGDNYLARPSITVYRVLEPEIVEGVKTAQVKGAESFELRYPDGPHNAETLLVDPRSGDLYIVTKEDVGPSLMFRAAAPLDPSAPIVLSAIARVGLAGRSFLGTAITGGDLSDGALLLRGHALANWWSRAPGQSVVDALRGPACPVPLAFPNELQGESVGLGPGDRSYHTIGEGYGVGVWRFDRSE